MKTAESRTLAGFIRQAEHYGSEEVFETALDEGLSLKDLCALSLRLQNLDPKWKLTLDAQRLFVLSMVEAGKSVKDAARIADVQQTTARTWQEFHENCEEHEPGGSFLALQRASRERFETLQGIVRGTQKRR